MSSPITHFKKDKNMKNKNNLELKGFSVDHEGRAIARDTNNRVILIENALPESTVLVEIKEEKKNYAIGEAIETISQASFQIKPKCVHALRNAKERCGGCTWQDMEYNKQLEYKKQILIDALARIGKIAKDSPLLDCEIVASRYQYNYRNKMEFAFSKDLAGNVILGLKASKSHEVLSVNCELSHKIINKVMHRLAFLCKEANLAPYDENTGYLRYANTRTSLEKGRLKDFLLEIITYPNSKHNAKLYEICKMLQSEFSEITGIVHSVRKNALNIAYGESVVGRFGTTFLVEKLQLEGFNLSLKHNAQSFFQVNSYGAEDLYSSIVRIVRGLDIKNIADIYCGVGGIGIAIAKAFKLANRPYSLHGLEITKQSIQLAEENAKSAEIEASFVLANASKLGAFLRDIKALDLIVLDPPRAGIDKRSLEILKKSKIKYILLVSCNPATLARDIAYLDNYEVKSLQAFDLFPHTSHVESLSLLELK